MALHSLAVASLGRSVAGPFDVCGVESGGTDSVSTSSNVCVKICSRNGASSRLKSASFFGARVASVSDSRSLKSRKTGPASIRAEGPDLEDYNDQSKAYQPSSEFYKVEAVLRTRKVVVKTLRTGLDGIRPWRLSPVSSGLMKMGIRGVTVTNVRGFGAQGGSRERQAGTEYAGDSFLDKVKLEIVVSSDQVEAVIDTIIDHARTGEIGDGKIFVSPVTDIIRVRTGGTRPKGGEDGWWAS